MSQSKCPSCERKILSVFACHGDKPYCLSCCGCDEHSDDWELDIADETISCCDCGFVSDSYVIKDDSAICLDCDATSDACQKCHGLIHGGNPFSTLCDKCLDVN